MTCVVSCLIMACCWNPCWIPCCQPMQPDFCCFKAQKAASASVQAVHEQSQPVVKVPDKPIPTPVEQKISPPVVSPTVQGNTDEVLSAWKSAMESGNTQLLSNLYSNPSDAHKWNGILAGTSHLSVNLSQVKIEGNRVVFDCNLQFNRRGHRGVWQKRYEWTLVQTNGAIQISQQRAL